MKDDALLGTNGVGSLPEMARATQAPRSRNSEQLSPGKTNRGELSGGFGVSQPANSEQLSPGKTNRGELSGDFGVSQPAPRRDLPVSWRVHAFKRCRFLGVAAHYASSVSFRSRSTSWDWLHSSRCHPDV
jgi:hypothetical protein